MYRLITFQRSVTFVGDQCETNVVYHDLHWEILRATYSCCVCACSTSTKFRPSPFELVFVLDKPLPKDVQYFRCFFDNGFDLGKACWGGRGHRSCEKCRNAVMVRGLTCWACRNDDMHWNLLVWVIMMCVRILRVNSCRAVTDVCIVTKVIPSRNGRLFHGSVNIWELVSMKSSFRDNVVISVSHSRTKSEMGCIYLLEISDEPL